MPAARSRSLLTAVLLAPAATGCFLSGDYRIEEETVVAPRPETSEEGTFEPMPSETTPPARPGAPPTATLDEPSTAAGSAASPSAGTSGDAAPPSSGVPTSALDSTEEQPALTSESNPTSALASAEETNPWQNSEGYGWDSSGGRCWQGDCNEGCGEGEVRGPQGRCYWFSAGQGSWNQAQTTCTGHGRGWVPIAIHDEQEDTFMSSQLNRNGETWLGARYAMGAWRWLDDNSAFWDGTGINGSEIDGVFAKWGTNEPSGSMGETCGRVESFNGDMRWGDSECNGIKLIACQSPAP